MTQLDFLGSSPIQSVVIWSQVHSLSTWSSGPSALTPSFWPWDSTINQKITLPFWILWTWSSQSSSLLSLPSSWLGLVSRSISKILGIPLILWLLLDLFLISLWQILVKEEQVSPCWGFSEPWDLSSSWQKESQFDSYYTPSSSHFRFECLEYLCSFKDFLRESVIDNRTWQLLMVFNPILVLG